MADKGYARSAVKSWLQITKAAYKCYFRLGRNGLRAHSNPAFHPSMPHQIFLAVPAVFVHELSRHLFIFQ